MAKKIKFNRISGNDILANSITTINQNFELLEDTLETQISNGVSSLQIGDVNWNTSGANGPSSTISLSNGNTARINPIPSADESQSGIITTGDQTIAGRKTFNQGIVADSIVDKRYHNIITADGDTVFVGGEDGIQLRYDSEGNLTDVEYGFLNGIDITEIISNSTTTNRSVEELRNYLESIRRQYDARFEENETYINNVSRSIAELNLEDIIGQTDGMVENWFGEPEEMQELLNEWTAAETLEDHIGDTFTDIVNRRCYKLGVDRQWRLLDESEYSAVVRALLNSLEAKSVADGKCTTFYQDNIPAPCYVGDIWIVKKSFYMDNGTQRDYIEGSTVDPNSTVVYMQNTMLFCIRDNDTNVPDINDWDKDLTTWSDIQFQKNVVRRFETTESAITAAQEIINAINDDNIFSVFEKRDFLNNTWYAIAGSYTYDPTEDIQYNEANRPIENPTDGFLGTSTSGSFWGAIMDCIGDNEETDIDVYNVALGELISAFKDLAEFCSTNGLFDNSISSSTFVTSRTSELEEDESNIGAVAKQELADLLYNYYREEEECKKSAYISAVSTTIDDLVHQSDHAIQNWYVRGVPTTQAALPWRISGEAPEDYGAADNKHISDTLVDLNSTLGQNIYKFSKFTNANEVGVNDRTVVGTNFYWNSINSSDTSAILEELGIDEQLAGMDGSINVFNSTPTNYSYGDIWFFNGFAQEDPNHSHLTQQQKSMFVEGCIYYCCNTDLDGDGSDGIRESLVPSDWADGYSKGNEFITRFANMASDSCLTPIEKNQLVRAFYEIAGVNLYGNDNDETDDILEDIFDDDNSNDGSFRFVISDCISVFTDKTLSSYGDFTDFMENNVDDELGVVAVIENLVTKFNDIKTALIQCGCLNTSVDTDLSVITFSGFENLTQYNGLWNTVRHITMLSDVFTTYYMEEDNLKTIIQQKRANVLADRLGNDIASVRNLAGLAQNAADAANNAISAINSNNVFSVSEKLSFLNNTWRKIAGSVTYNASANAINGQGKPQSGYLGTGANGTFWIAIKDLDFRPSTPRIVSKFKQLAKVCNHFGLFDATLVPSNFGTGNGTDYDADDLYDALYEYYNEEELLRQNAYAQSVNATLDALRTQIDGKISTYYGEGLPPNTQQGLSKYWDDSNDNHINDEYKDTEDLSRVYIFKKIVSETTLTNDDVPVESTEGTYYWKMVASSNISNIISQFQDAYDEALATIDGFIQVFGEETLPHDYNYGDIWFFGGTDKITDNYSGIDFTSFVAGNIYYCSVPPLNGDSDWDTFDPLHWTVGSNTGSLTQRLAYMTSDDWLTAIEKRELLDDWYAITGIDLSSFSNNVNNVINTIENSSTNTGSYYTLVSSYSDLTGIEMGGELEPEPQIDYSVPISNATVMIGSNTLNNIKFTCVESGDINSYAYVRVKEGFPYYIVGYKDSDNNMFLADRNFGFNVDSKDTVISEIYVVELNNIDRDNNPISKIEGLTVIFNVENDNDAQIVIDFSKTQYLIREYQTKQGDAFLRTSDQIIILPISVSNISSMYDTITIRSEYTGGVEVGNSPSLDIELTKARLENALKNIFRILVAVGCKESELTDSDLRLINIPQELSSYGVGTMSSVPTLISDIFNRYYAEERNLSVELTDLQITTTLSDDATVQELAEGIGGKGFILSSLIQLEYNDEVVGGLDGVTANNDNVGMWFGGTVEVAQKTLNNTLNNNESPVPVIITKNGLDSRIGPFKIGNSDNIFIGNETSGNVTVISTDYVSMGASYSNSDTKNEAKTNATLYLDREGIGSRIGPLKVGSSDQIFIGNEDSGNVTVIDTGYISMGASYSDSDTKSDARENAIIFLDSDGEGSRIGPLKIKTDSNDRILTFGQSRPVFRYKRRVSDSLYHRQLCSVTSSTSIDSHTFDSGDLNKEIQYGTGIVDWQTVGGDTPYVEPDINNDNVNPDPNSSQVNP